MTTSLFNRVDCLNNSRLKRICVRWATQPIEQQCRPPANAKVSTINS
ncbi:MAG: hypothetical protein H0W13_02320 [Nitrospirales bacterium]|nr:hypothetical protein [Nitrospirales bacterium]